ncbi:hypothetical protein [Aliirhizobium smilacinae]|uniref:PEP-CTERM sorting domain-containing protein n=1 Tax=Aliirhizobium smilacinae TaxID=1395944 RepID=A0A5C4XPL4_9HYPH|nr:hypothetical protein [Rhizobium smilacinae]TNM65287.1 hypothetical protein FHP24_03125 [Rhizobium smilacinae]
MMKLKTLMLAAALAFGSISAAQAAFPAPATKVTSTDEANYVNIYNSWVSGWTSVFNATVGNNWTTRTYGEFEENFYSEIPAVTIMRTYLAPNIQAFQAIFSYQGGSITYTQLPAGTAVPVPGPEAGAGIGALAMLGLAYWAKRRRNSAQTA